MSDCKEKYISFDASRSKWRVELRLARNKSVSRRVGSIEEARTLRDEWLVLRESMATDGPHVAVPADDAPASPPPAAEPAAAPACATSSDDEASAPCRGSITVRHLKDAPPHKHHRFTVAFD
jgi:hypothetical protein